MKHYKCWYCNDICKHRNINDIFTYFTIINILNSELSIKKEADHNNIYNYKLRIRNNNQKKIKQKDVFLCIPLYISTNSKKDIKLYFSNINKCRQKLRVNLEKKYKDSNLCLYPSIDESCNALYSSLNFEPPFHLEFDKGIGIFCSVPCMWAYIYNFSPFNTCISLRNEAEKCIAIYIRYVLIRTIGLSNNIYIPSILNIFSERAPSIAIIKEYGGFITRKEYRNKLNDIMDRCVQRMGINLYDAYRSFISNYNKLHKQNILYIKLDVFIHREDPLPIMKMDAIIDNNDVTEKKIYKKKENSKNINYKISEIKKQTFRSLPNSRSSIASIYAFLS